MIIALVLLFCNLFPSPAGQYIRLQDQKKDRMRAVVRFLQGVPPGSVILTENQGALLLSYYLCHDNAVPLIPPYQHYFEAPCGQLRIVSLDPQIWMFSTATFPDELHTLERTYGLAPGQPVWLVQASWVINETQDFRAHLPNFGCPAAQNFG